MEYPDYDFEIISEDDLTRYQDLRDTGSESSTSFGEFSDVGDDPFFVDGSFSSTDISISDGVSFSDISDTEMSDEEGYRSATENTGNENGLDNNDENQDNSLARARSVLRSRRQTRGNVAPIPPSRLSVVSDSDTEVNSNVDDVEENENENENEEVNEVIVEGEIDSSNSDVGNNENLSVPAEPTVNNENAQQPEQVGEQPNDADEANGGTDASTQVSPARSRRRPLSEITSGQHSPDIQDKALAEQAELTPKAKKKRMSPDLSDCDDDGMTCSVCLDSMTNSGVHRIVSLNCGHLFGKSCVERWLKSGCMGGTRRCPSCNKKASLKDVRAIYAKKLRALDTAERDRIQMELDKVKTEKAKLETDYMKVKLNCEMQKKQIESLQERIRFFESSRSSLAYNDSGSIYSSQNRLLNTSVSHANTVVVNKAGGCRVLGCSSEGIIVVSQKSPTPYFFGYGVCIIRSIDQKPVVVRYDFHDNGVRDLAFHPKERHQLLTVSLDRTAKLSDVNNNRTLMTFNGNNLLWSCAWDASNPYQFMTGSQNGIVTIYDVRNSMEPLHVCLTPGDTTPVVSLAPVPPTSNSVLENGGLISCRLNSVYALHSDTKENELVMLDGPFISLSYNTMSKLLLLSTRPSSRFPATRHMLNQLASPGGGKFSNDLHTFTCGKSSQLMSRSCQLMMSDGDVWVGAHNETEHAVQLLSVNRSGPLHTIPVPEPILDICPFTINNTLLVGSLSEKSLFLHKVC